MSLKQSIIDLLTELRTINVVNNDGQTVPLYAAVYNQQPEREIEGGDTYIYPKPAIFVEPKFGDSIPIGGGATGVDITFSFTLVHEKYNIEGALDEDLDVFDLSDKVYRKLNGLKLSGCSPLYQSGTRVNVDHNNVNYISLDYASHFIDLTGTAYDSQNTDSILAELVNAEVVIFDAVVNEINQPSPAPYVPSISEIINSFSCSVNNSGELFLNINSATIFQSEIESTQSFMVDWGNGSTSEVVVGGSGSAVYSPDSPYNITITGAYGLMLIIPIITDSNGVPIDYPSSYTCNINYDVSSELEENYPFYLETKITMAGNATLKSFKMYDASGARVVNAQYSGNDFKHYGVLSMPNNYLKHEISYKDGGNTLTLSHLAVLSFQST